MVEWAYGVTTVPQRLEELLPRTLRSLKAAGFPNPRLFVDGWDGRDNRYLWTTARPGEWELEVTARWPLVRAAVNWTLSLTELVLRHPKADYYAVFQDDLVTGRNLREYLERNPPPADGYGSLYTAPSNFFPQLRRAGLPCPDDDYVGWYRSHQLGRGVVATVFSRDAALTLLGKRDLLERPADPRRGWRSVDGGIVTVMNAAGYTEYVHAPALVHHVGKVSTIDKRKRATTHDPNFPAYTWLPYYDQTTFPGESFDFLTLLAANGTPRSLQPEPPATGAAAYGRFPEEHRARLVAAWQAERLALAKAIVADRERLKTEAYPPAVRKLTKMITRYEEQLIAVERNDPPYLTAEDREILGVAI